MHSTAGTPCAAGGVNFFSCLPLAPCPNGRGADASFLLPAACHCALFVPYICTHKGADALVFPGPCKTDLIRLFPGEEEAIEGLKEDLTAAIPTPGIGVSTTTR